MKPHGHFLHIMQNTFERELPSQLAHLEVVGENARPQAAFRPTRGKDDGAYKMDNSEHDAKAAVNSNMALWKPNVTQDHTVFEYSLLDKVQNPKVIIYDQVGREVFSANLNGQKGTLNYNMQPLAAGMYYWKLISMDTELLAGKLLKQ